MAPNWIDALYNQFLGRDLLGKVGPGFVVFFGLTHFLDAYSAVRSLPSAAWVVVFVLAWLTGLAVQGLGESVGLIRYYPKVCGEHWRTTEEKWQRKVDKCLLHPNFQSRRQSYERLVVIKEAAGVAFIALSLAIALTTSRFLYLLEAENPPSPTFTGYGVPLFIVAAAMVAALFYMHRMHVRRQDDFLNRLLKDE